MSGADEAFNICSHSTLEHVQLTTTTGGHVRFCRITDAQGCWLGVKEGSQKLLVSADMSIRLLRYHMKRFGVTQRCATAREGNFLCLHKAIAIRQQNVALVEVNSLAAMFSSLGFSKLARFLPHIPNMGEDVTIHEEGILVAIQQEAAQATGETCSPLIATQFGDFLTTSTEDREVVVGVGGERQGEQALMAVRYTLCQYVKIYPYDPKFTACIQDL